MKLSPLYKYLLFISILAVFFVLSGNVFAVRPPTIQDVQMAQIGVKTAVTNAVGGFTIDAISFLIKGVLYIIISIVSGLIYLLGYLISAALDFNISILDFDPPFIITGWQIFRDIANLGFVLGIIIIGVATILRIKNYRAQEILWKLIVAALIVNFSLVIAGSFIQVANSFSSYIVSYIGAGGSDDIGTGVARLGDSFKFFELQNTIGKWGFDDNASQFNMQSAGSQLLSAVNMGIFLVFSIMVFFSLLAFCVLLFLRYFYLSFLLIISPIVWLLWIFPDTKKHWGKWWSSFLNWVLYAPLVLFFVYLSLAVNERYAQYTTEKYNAGEGVDIGVIVSSLVSIALLVGGMKIAKKMGEEGAGLAFSFADKAKSWAAGKVKRGSARVGRKALKTEVGGKTMQQRIASWGKFKSVDDLRKEKEDAKKKGGIARATAGAMYGTKMVGKTLSKITGVGVAKRAAMKRVAVGMKSAEKFSESISQESSSAFEKKIKDYSHNDIKDILPALNKEDTLVALKKLSDMDKIGKAEALSILGPEKLLNVLEHGKSLGKGKDVSAIEKKIAMNTDMLEAASDVDTAKSSDEKTKAETALEEATKKFLGGFSKDDVGNIDKDIAKAISTGELEGFPGGEAIGKALKKTVEDFSGEITRGVLHGISSRLEDSKDLMKYYRNVIYSIVDKNDPKIKESVKQLLDVGDDISVANFDAVMDILKSSNVTRVSNFAKKFKKVIGTRIGLIDDEDKKSKDKKDDKDKSEEKGDKEKGEEKKSKK